MTLLALALLLLAPCHAARSAAPVGGQGLPYVTWLFDQHNDQNGNPHCTVFLCVNDKRIPILRNAEYAFSTLKPQDYPVHDVPAQAVAACTSWWAGQGDDLYVVRRGRRLTVFLRELDEQAPTPAYTRLKSIPVH